jgi:type I restriction-modification system DNA methylase subunit
VTSTPRREEDVLRRIRDILGKFVSQKFNEVTIAEVREQYEVDGRFADLAILKDDGKPILLIETKKVRHHARGFRVERRFIVTSEDVVGQVVAYATILKKRGIYVPFAATANDKQLALFKVPENIDELVDWKAIKDRRYDRVIKNFYEFRGQNLIFHKPHNFSEEIFKDLLDTVTGIYKKKYGIEEKRQELHWIVIEDLRGFVDFLSPFIEGAIAPNGRFRPDLGQRLDEYSQRTGYRPTPDGLAREMAYVLMNKIVFYKVLERFYNLPRLEPLHEKDVVTTCSSYIKKLNEYFEKAVELSNDFEAIFRTGVYDVTENDVVENEEVLNALDWLIRYLGQYKIEELGDIIGYIYEELIPPEERHVLGQFYTPKPIAELIVRWAVRSPDDKVLDPGCGSGTFLVETYKRLAELKLKRSFKEIKHVPKDVHEQILSQLYGIDINEFPAHLTAMNLAMKNVRMPSPSLNVFKRDYFTILPGHKTVAPYEIKTPKGEKKVEVVFKDFDAVVGNPPYTRWNEIRVETREMISELYRKVLRKYNLRKFVTGGAIPGIFVPWIIHSTNFLREGGRLGMIISDSWLGTQYGVNFVKYLADKFKIVAIIDLAERVFEVPLIGACIILLEKTSNKNERDSNNIVFVYLKKQYDVDTILRTIEDAREGKVEPREGMIISVIIQGELYRHLEKGDVKPITLFFNVKDIINAIASTKNVVNLGDLFQPSEGNTGWSVYASMRGRGAGVGGEEFYYLDEDKVRQFNLDEYVGIYLRPLISSPERLSFFTFNDKDWEKKKEYIFMVNAPFTLLPSEIQSYIRLGETTIQITKGPNRGRPVSESTVAKEREELGTVDVLSRSVTFYDWYDLGGVIEAPIYVARGVQYWVRFVFAGFQCALDDRILALIPRQGVQFDEVELKALLTYLNSSFTQLQAEVMGRSTGGGMIELDVRPLNTFLVLNVKALPREDVERLAQLFDRLEFEARRLGGANEAENVFGSELAKELTGREDVRVGIQGLFNTVIKEIDYEIARVLGLEHLVEAVRAMVLEFVRRRLSRAREPRREAIRGSEEHRELQRPRRRRGSEGGGGFTRRLDEFF